MSYLIQKDVKRSNQRALQADADQLLLQVGSGTGQPVVDDVLTAFNAMGSTGVLININKGSQWPSDYNNYIPPYTYHIEGMQRFRPNPAGGSTFFAMTGVGSKSSKLFIAELPNNPATPGKLTGGSAPAGSITKVIDIDTTYTHAGGFQVNGDLLAVGIETGCDAMARMIPAGFPGACQSGAKVVFYNVSDPLNPVRLSASIPRDGTSAGAVGILKQSSGAWMAVVGNNNNEVIDLYVQNPDGSFHSAASWNMKELIMNVPGQKYKSYQTMNLILQSDGTIFMVATTRDPLMIGHDYFDLFTIQPSGGGRAQITMVASKAVSSTGADFSAAGVIYVDTSSSIIGYGSSWLPGLTTSDPPMPGDIIHFNEY